MIVRSKGNYTAQKNPLNLGEITRSKSKSKDFSKSNAIKDICLNCTNEKCKHGTCKRYEELKHEIV